MAQRILEEATAYARDRKQFGKAIGEFQLIQAMLADSQAELLAGWSLVQDVARRFDVKPAHVSDPDVSMRVGRSASSSSQASSTVCAARGRPGHSGSLAAS